MPNNPKKKPIPIHPSCNACHDGVRSTADQIRCAICRIIYHKLCVSLPSDADAAALSTWMCPECQSSRRRGGDNSNTPVRNIVSTRSLQVEDSAQCPMKTPSSLSIESTPEDDIVKRIGDKIDIKVNCKFDAMKQELMSDLREDIKSLVQAEVKKHLEKLKTEFTDATDYLAANYEDLKKTLVDKEREIENLSTKCARMESDIRSMNKKYEEFDRQGRSRNLEIQMVSEKKNENVLQLFKNICSTVGCTISDTDINACRRVAKFDQKSRRPRNIVVTLSSTTHRDNILSAVFRYNKAHKDNVLNCSNIGINDDKSTVYVVEHLSTECKALFAGARRVKKEKSYQFAWVKYGRVYMRKNEESRAILIKSMDSLSRLD